MALSKFKKPILIALVGEKLAGKEVVANYLVKNHRFTSLRFSQLVVNILNILHIPVTRANQVKIMVALRRQFGGGVLAQALRQQITYRKLKRVVIDGIRHPDEFKIFKDNPGFCLVYVTAPLVLRYQRALKRGEKVGETKLTLTQFKREEKMPTEIHIRAISHASKVKLINDSTLVDLHKQVEEKIVKRFC